MRVALCDFCLAEGKVRVSGWRVKSGPARVTVDVCADHRHPAGNASGWLEVADQALVEANRLIGQENGRNGGRR